MTTAIGIQTFDGLVLCADSQYTSDAKTHGPKIFPWIDHKNGVLFAIAGDVPNALATVQQCQTALNQNRGKERDSETLLDTIRFVVRCGQEAYVDKRPLPERDTAQFSLLIAIVTAKETPRIFYTSKAAVVEFVGGRPYEALGSGGSLAEFLLRVGWNNSIDVDRAIVLAIRAIAATKLHDVYSGGPIYFTTIRNGIVSDIVPFRISDAERIMIEKFEPKSSDLLLEIANRKSSKEEFHKAVQRFADDMFQIRKELSEGGDHFQELMDSLARTRKT